ncbi:MAG: hypothetical protein K6A30_00725 [Lachnospiraceae bacterium]|nr:hypothetical protein [Lachnospiraceae bacterium]
MEELFTHENCLRCGCMIKVKNSDANREEAHYCKNCWKTLKEYERQDVQAATEEKVVIPRK